MKCDQLSQQIEQNTFIEYARQQHSNEMQY